MVKQLKVQHLHQPIPLLLRILTILKLLLQLIVIVKVLIFNARITSQKKSTSYEWNYSKATHRFFRNDYSYSFDVKDNKPLILCSHLDVGENEKNTDFDNSIGWINVGGVGIAIRITEFDGDIAKFKKWLDDNEVYVVAPRSKPITVNLSKDEAAQAVNKYYN